MGQQACCAEIPDNRIYENPSSPTKIIYPNKSEYYSKQLASTIKLNNNESKWKKIENQPLIQIKYIKQKLQQLGPFQPKSKYQKGTIKEIRINQRGDIYSGQWKNNVFHGMGKLYNISQEYFQGIFIQGNAEKEGRYIYPEGAYYEGHIQSNLANGQGLFAQDKQGYQYVGQWKNNKPNGYGKQQWKQGSVYIGEFLEGMKHGNGKYIKGMYSYQGHFQNNNISLNGVFKWPDGRQYDGSWKQGNMHGYGIYKWPDGNRYEGEYKNSLKDGYGKYYWSDGRIYDGLWKNGKKNGKGTLILANGKQMIGQWQNGNIKIQKEKAI